MFVTEILPTNKVTRSIRRENLPDGVLAATNIRLVDFESLIPALQIIERDTSGDPVRRFVLKDGIATYFHIEEIIQWGDRHGYRFVNKSDIDPRWIEYHRLHRQVSDAIKRIVDIETDLKLQKQHTVTPSLNLSAKALPAGDVSVVEIPPSLTATSLIQKCAEKELDEVRKALRREKAARKRDAKLIQLLKDCMTPTALEKLLKSGTPKKHKPKDDGKLRPVCFPVDDGELLPARPLGGFDEILPKERLLAHAKPVRIRSTSGIYFLLDDDGEIVYIGQAVILVQRIGPHCSEKQGMFSKVFAVAVPTHRLFELETKYIRAYQPKLNKSNGRRVA